MSDTRVAVKPYVVGPTTTSFVVPASEPVGTTVYSRSLDDNTDVGGWDGYTAVIVFPPTTLGAATGTQIRLTLNFAGLSNGATAVFYMGRWAGGSSDLWDFNTTPSHITFSSGDITGNGSTLDYVSDWVNLPEAYNPVDGYLLAGQFTGTTVDFSNVIDPGRVYYFKLGADAATVDKTGYTIGAAINLAILVATIEIQ